VSSGVALIAGAKMLRPSTTAIAPRSPSVTMTRSALRASTAAAASTSSSSVSVSASRWLTNSARAPASLAGGRRAKARASSSPQVT